MTTEPEPLGFPAVIREALELYTPLQAPVDVGERWPVTRTGERTPINRTVRRLVYDRDNRRCRFCTERPRLLALDHVIPWSAGGPDTANNLRSLCHPCNDARSNYRTDLDHAETHVTLACDDCVLGWVRAYGPSLHSRTIPGNPQVPAYCGTCRNVGYVTDPRRLR